MSDNRDNDKGSLSPAFSCDFASFTLVYLPPQELFLTPEVTPEARDGRVCSNRTMLLNGLALLALVPAAYADSGDQGSVPSLTPPSRPLQWGDINIIHTTDTHGWLLGHQKSSFPEPNYRCAHSVILRVDFMLTREPAEILVISSHSWLT